MIFAKTLPNNVFFAPTRIFYAAIKKLLIYYNNDKAKTGGVLFFIAYNFLKCPSIANKNLKYYSN